MEDIKVGDTIEQEIYPSPATTLSMKINGSKGIIGLPSSSPGGNLNRNANSSMNTFHKTSSKGSAESKDTINNSVGWAFFLENKSASTAELWKEPPQIEVFPV